MSTPTDLDKKAKEAADGIIGITVALMAARSTMGDIIVSSFLDRVTEKGEALWDRFRAFQKEKTSEELEVGFTDFISYVYLSDKVIS